MLQTEEAPNHLAELSHLDRVLQDDQQLTQCAYSIAVVALVEGPQQAACVDWLLKNFVNAHGSRPHSYLSWQDVYIAAYATALALREADYRDASAAILGGLRNNQNDNARTETLTFGGLVGALDRYAVHRFGLVIEHSAHIQVVIADEALKLRKMLHWPDFFNPERSVAGFTGESLYGNDQLDLDRYVDSFTMPNGSITSSPSASAMTVLNYQRIGRQPPQRLIDYVHSLNPYTRNVGVLDHVPHFVTGWTLMYADHWRDELIQAEEVQALHQALSQSPLVCAGATTYPGDLDTSAVAMIGLNWPSANRQMQIEAVSPDLFDEGKGCYRTYLFERNASVSTNVHLLAAWPDNPRRDAMLAWISAELEGPCERWLCKWHVSPYYIAGEICRLLGDLDQPIARSLVQRAREFLIDTQRADGGWGIAFSTTEETAYAVLALAASAPKLIDQHPVLQAEIEHGQMFLRKTPDYTPLWIGKTLYCVRPLVQVMRHSALFHLWPEHNQG